MKAEKTGVIVDFHAHTFPDAIAAAAVAKLGAAAHIPPYTDGTDAALAASMRAAGIGLAVSLPVATNPLKVEKLNDFAAAKNGADGIVRLGAMHPLCPTLRRELRRARELGLRGIKIHPVYQDVDIDAPPFLRLLEAAAENGLFTVMHAGADIGFPGVRRCAPAQIAAALRQVGDVPLVLAHMGGWKNWDDVPQLAEFPSVMLDTSFSLGEFRDADGSFPAAEKQLLEEAEFLRLVRLFGAGRVLFGTDSPWTDQKESLARVCALPLTAEERAKILGGNALALLGIPAEA